jgi:outer membrane biosynthesis protein TonB
MFEADFKAWAQKLVEELSKGLQGGFGSQLCGRLSRQVHAELLKLFSQTLNGNAAQEMAAWASEKVSEALGEQFAQGLPAESLAALIQSALDMLTKEVKSGVAQPAAEQAVSHSAWSALEDWAAGIAEDLTNELLQIMRKHGRDAVVQQTEGKPKARKRPAKKKRARRAKPKKKPARKPAGKKARRSVRKPARKAAKKRGPSSKPKRKRRSR